MVAGGCKGRDWLASTSYPGRGLVVGCTADGTANPTILVVLPLAAAALAASLALRRLGGR